MIYEYFIRYILIFIILEIWFEYCKMDQPTTSSEIYKREDDCEITWKHPSHIFQRLLALFFMCLIGFGK